MARIDPREIARRAKGERDKMNALGYEARLGLIDNADSVSKSVTALLLEKAYDCVLIGAGVHTIDEYALLFETLVNDGINMHLMQKYVSTQARLTQ